jgi:hypothetical protein
LERHIGCRLSWSPPRGGLPCRLDRTRFP